MPGSNKKRLPRKDPDSGDEADIPKDRKSSDGSKSSGSKSSSEQPASSEASGSSSAQTEGAVGGVDTSSGLEGVSEPTCGASNWIHCSDSTALISEGACGSTETSGKKPGVFRRLWNKISPKKSETDHKDIHPKKSETDHKDIHPKKSETDHIDIHPGMYVVQDITCLERTSEFQPYSVTTYNASSIKSLEDATESAEVNSMAEIVSIPPDSTPATPLNKPDNNEGTPTKIRKLKDEKDNDDVDKADDDDKAKRT